MESRTHITDGQGPEKARKINVRSVALPAEHGGWGFITEPLILGLLLAASGSGLSLAVAFMALFLLHQPLKISIKDRLKGRITERTQLAQRFVLIYGGVALIFGVLALLMAQDYRFLLPLALGTPLVIIQNIYDARNQSRNLVAEMSGALALATTAPALLLLGDWALLDAFMVWLILASRTVTSIDYVRSKLRLERDKPAQIWLTYALHLGAVVMFGLLALGDLVPVAALLAMILLLIRALLTLRKEAVKPKVVGFRELGLGLVTVILVALGYLLNF